MVYRNYIIISFIFNKYSFEFTIYFRTFMCWNISMV
nr:MAG TPA: hypothetical protein [Bacteriophage sp.]DAT16710.1 MAG TPA: hypothetical protein [Caudoviricetes sp.]